MINLSSHLFEKVVLIYTLTKKFLSVDYEIIGFGIVDTLKKNTSSFPIYYLEKGKNIKSSDLCIMVNKDLKDLKLKKK